MTPFDVLANLLPIEDGAFSVAVHASQPATLEYRGVDLAPWSNEATEPVERALVVELPDAPTEVLEPVLRAWADGLREVFASVNGRPKPVFAFGDLFDAALVKRLVKSSATYEAARDAWKKAWSSWLPFDPALEPAEAAINAFFAGETREPMAEHTGETGAESLEFVATERVGARLCVVVRLVVWDKNGDQLSIRDVKEQQVHFLEPGPGAEPARITAFLTALRETLSEGLGKLDPETLMPHDLLPSPQEWKRGATADDFKKLLRTRFKLS